MDVVTSRLHDAGVLILHVLRKDWEIHFMDLEKVFPKLKWMHLGKWISCRRLRRKKRTIESYLEWNVKRYLACVCIVRRQPGGRA